MRYDLRCTTGAEAAAALPPRPPPDGRPRPRPRPRPPPLEPRFMYTVDKLTGKGSVCAQLCVLGTNDSRWKSRKVQAQGATGDATMRDGACCNRPARKELRKCLLDSTNPERKGGWSSTVMDGSNWNANGKEKGTINLISDSWQGSGLMKGSDWQQNRVAGTGIPYFNWAHHETTRSSVTFSRRGPPNLSLFKLIEKLGQIQRVWLITATIPSGW